MIATTPGYDVVFLIHILSAVAVLAVLITLRFAAKAAATNAPVEKLKKAFPVRTNWGARILHLMPITGAFLVAQGTSADSMSKPWVGVGLACYILAAGHMEARTLPMERKIAKAVASDGAVPTELSKKFALNVDVLLSLIAVAFIAMIVQF